jgi:catechol 2,3-dioxygenase-like lactoylglutathione lyase family enzyme
MSVQRLAPVLPVRNVAAALERYAKLGFEGDAYREAGDEARGPIYGFLHWGTVELHLTRFDELDPNANTSACYLYVDDADALFARWKATGIEGRFVAPVDTPYGLREFAYVDPDGNLLRVGSELAS